MNTYYHKDGSGIKEGDVCFYTEYNIGDDFGNNYANSLAKIVSNGNGELVIRHLLFTLDNGETFIESESDDELDLIYYCSDRSNTAIDLYKIDPIFLDTELFKKTFTTKNKEKFHKNLIKWTTQK